MFDPVQAEEGPANSFDPIPQAPVVPVPPPAAAPDALPSSQALTPADISHLMQMMSQIPPQGPPPAAEAEQQKASPAGPPPAPGTVPDLAANCNAGLLTYQSANPDVHVGQCSGFIDAVMQDLQLRRKQGDKLGICITGHVSELDIIKIFAAWAGRHPEPIMALDGVHAALKEAYPCGK